MKIYYVRHGEPIYNPDSITYLGEQQAYSIGKKLAQIGIDKIYASNSNRAIQTATPLAKMLKKEIVELPFANEHYVFTEFAYEDQGTIFYSPSTIKFLAEYPEIYNMGFEWYNHELFKDFNYKAAVERVANNLDELFLSLGYSHERNKGRYKILNSSNEKVAFFAHALFGNAFLSCVLDIPYPLVYSHFSHCLSGLTVIDFEERDGYAYPKVLTFSNDSHLEKDGVIAGPNGKTRNY